MAFKCQGYLYIMCTCVTDESSDGGEMPGNHHGVWTFATRPTTCSAWHWW